MALTTYFSVYVALAAALAAQNPDRVEPTLKTLLEGYFRAAIAEDRAKAAAEIAERFSVQEVVSQVQLLDLWPAIQNQNPPGQPSGGEWKITLPSGRSVQMKFVVPPGYDPSKRVPLIFGFNLWEEGGGSAQFTAGFHHAWVSLDEPIGGSFYLSASEAADLPALLREVRRRIHVSIDRIYLFGQRSDGDAAWVAGMMYAHQFAALAVNSGIPRVPYPEQTYALFLPNLRGMPILSVWADPEPGKDPSQVSVVNKAILNFASAAGMLFDAVTVAPQPSDTIPTPQSHLLKLISDIRQPKPTVAHWFRYLPQGNLGWLRATELGGEVWDDEQISIAVTADADRDEFITKCLKENLFYLSGKIEGQTIKIETRRLEGIELRLSPEQLDLAQPISIEINGRKRFEGLPNPSVIDLLESAYEDWDFQHPVHVRKRFSIKPD